MLITSLPFVHTACVVAVSAFRPLLVLVYNIWNRRCLDFRPPLVVVYLMFVYIGCVCFETAARLSVSHVCIGCVLLSDCRSFFVAVMEHACDSALAA